MSGDGCCKGNPKPFSGLVQRSLKINVPHDQPVLRARPRRTPLRSTACLDRLPGARGVDAARLVPNYRRPKSWPGLARSAALGRRPQRASHPRIRVPERARSASRSRGFGGVLVGAVPAVALAYRAVADVPTGHHGPRNPPPLARRRRSHRRFQVAILAAVRGQGLVLRLSLQRDTTPR